MNPAIHTSGKWPDIVGALVRRVQHTNARSPQELRYPEQLCL